MKLQDFLIGIGLFALFTIVIFGAINTNVDGGIYSEDYLNITHDTETLNKITNISNVGTETGDDFEVIKGDIRKFRQNATGEPEERSLVADAMRVLLNIPSSFGTATKVLGMTESEFGVPSPFTKWLLSSIVIIVLLLILSSFLKNPLRS